VSQSTCSKDLEAAGDRPHRRSPRRRGHLFKSIEIEAWRALWRVARRPFDLFHVKEEQLSNTDEAAAYLAAYLNRGDRSRIGNPRKNTWFVSFVASNAHEVTRLGESLTELGVKYQINYTKAGRKARSAAAYVATYWYDDQKRLFEEVRDQLTEPKRKLLEDLVLARSPIPADLRGRMRATIRSGKSYEYLADRLNELDIVVGRRAGPWTPQKLLLALGFE